MKVYLNNLSRNDLLRAIYALATIIAVYFIFPFWSVMLIVWFSSGFAMIFFGLTRSLPRKPLLAWHITFVLYPLLESILKAMIYFNIIPYSWLPLNIAEHFLWAFSMTFFLIPIFENYHLTNQGNRFQILYKIFIVISLVTLIGNMNEFVEFLIRYFSGLNTVFLYAIYYSDSIRDMALNTLGSICAILIIQRFFTK